MKLFSKQAPQKSITAILIGESEKHKNVFRSTADGLKTTNEKIIEEQDRLQDEIDARKIQIESLQDVKVDNLKVIEKIIAFLED